MQILRDYLSQVSIKERKEMAKSMGYSYGYLMNVAYGVAKKISADFCIKIEEETKRKIRCEQIRPDLNWAYIRRGKVK